MKLNNKEQKLVEEWLKRNKPTKCPTRFSDHKDQKMIVRFKYDGEKL